MSGRAPAGQRGIDGGERNQRRCDEDRSAADAVGQRAGNRQPDEIRDADDDGDEQAVGLGEMEDVLAERGV